jgi:hypothetical protein
VLTGLVWSLIIGLPLIATIAWSNWDLNWRTTVAMFGSYLALAAILGGLYFGRKIAKLTGKQAAVSRDGRWLLASWKDWLAPVLVFVVFVMASPEPGLEAFALAVGCSVAAGLIAIFVRPAVWPATPRLMIVLIGLAAGLLPLAAVLLLMWVTNWRLDTTGRQMVLYLTGFLSFLVTVRVIALAETTRVVPIGAQPEFSKRTRTLTQAAVALGVLALIPLYGSSFGRPWRTLMSAAIEADQPIPLPEGGSGYFKVNNGSDHPQWYEVTGLSDDAELFVRSAQASGQHSHEKEQTLLLLQKGTTVGSIVHASDETQGETVTATTGDATRKEFRLNPIPELGKDATIELSTTERKPYLLKLTGSQQETWQGTWKPRIQGAPEGSSLMMVFPETSSEHKGEVVDLSRRKADFGIPSGSFSASYPRAIDTSFNGLFYSLTEGHADVTLTATFRGAGPTEKDADGNDVPVNDIYIPVLLSLNTEAGSLHAEGLNLMGARRYIDARPKLEAAATLSPDNHIYQNNFAWCLVAIATTTKETFDSRAVDIAKTAVTLVDKNPNDSEYVDNVTSYLDTLAHAEYLSNNLIGAREAWSRLYKLDPKYYDSDPLCVNDKQRLKELEKMYPSGK